MDPEARKAALDKLPFRVLVNVARHNGVTAKKKADILRHLMAKDGPIIGIEEELPSDPDLELPYLSAGEIETVDDLEERDVDMLEWGGKVRIKQLTQKQLDEALDEVGARENGGQIKDMSKFRRVLIHRGCIKPRLSEKQIEGLADKGMQPLERLSGEIAAISGVYIQTLGNA